MARVLRTIIGMASRGGGRVSATRACDGAARSLLGCLLSLVLTVFGCFPSEPASSASAAKSESTAPAQQPQCKSGPSRRPDVVVLNEQTMAPKPKLQHLVAPDLTEYAKQFGLQGEIVLRCVITRHGAVADCCVARGVDGLDEAVIAAVQKWEYDPFTVHGIAVDVEYIIIVRIVQR